MQERVAEHWQVHVVEREQPRSVPFMQICLRGDVSGRKVAWLIVL